MRAPEEIQKEIIATNGKLLKLQRELQFAERFQTRKGWVGIRRNSELCFVHDEETIFPVNEKIIWLEWYGFFAKDGELAVAFDMTDGKKGKTIGYGEQLANFMSWATIGFFKTKKEARDFIKK